MNRLNAVGVAVAACACSIVLLAPGPARAATAQEDRTKQEAEIPKCDKKYGAIAVVEPQQQWWVQYNLGSPAALIKVYVQKSGCFTLVDRGKGMQAAQAERALASSGELRGGSNIGKGQVKAADYVLVPDLISQNKNAGGNRFGAALGHFLPGAVGAVAGGINLKKKTADVVLTVTDVRSSEQLVMAEGHRTQTDLGWGAGGGLFAGGGFAAGGASGYDNTEIGQVIALAYLQAYIEMVHQFSQLPDNASAANEKQSVTMSKPGKMYSAASDKASVVRPLDPGMMLYPTGNKNGVWWEVEDELGNKGWVSSILFQLAK